MSILTDNLITRNLIQPLWEKLDGKKSAIGAASFLLWTAIYALPAFTPEYNWITVGGTWIRDALIANGIHLDNTAYNTGVAFTVLGLIDKWRKSRKPSEAPSE